MKAKRILPALLAGLLTASSILAVTVLPATAIETEEIQKYVTVAQPVTNIVGDVAIVRDINSAEEMTAMVNATPTPATALYTLNADLQALDKDGQPFATMNEIFCAHGYSILPGFRVNDTATANALIAYLDGIGFYDCMLISADTAIMKTLRDALPSTFGVIDYTDTYKNETALTTEQCLDIRRSMKTYGGNVAILPPHLCAKTTVQYLYGHQVNVWTRISDEPTVTEQYNALLSGAVGVISDATESLLDIACNKLAEDTMTRTPLNVGHRGIPTLAPECTVEGSLLAYEQSANVVEMDVFLTADGHIAAMHDNTTGDTCNGNLNMETSTLAELKELYVNRGWEGSSKYSQLRIPTLNEYMDAFKDKDCMLFIEIKAHENASSEEKIVRAIRDMVNEYDMYDQVNVITFDEQVMAYMREYWPEMSLGVLIEGWYNFMAGPIPEEDLRETIYFAGRYNGTVNPPYEDYNKDEIRAFMIRGISVNPWTFYGDQDYKAHFLDGFASLTGNDANVIKRLCTGVAYNLDSTEVQTGDSISLNLDVSSYDRKVKSLAPKIVSVLEGEELVEIKDGTMTFTGEEGEVTFVLGYKDRTLDYSLYTQPITVSITDEVETEPVTEPVTEPETEPTTEPVTEPATEPVTEPDTTPNTEATDNTTVGDSTNVSGTKFEDPGCKSSVTALIVLAPLAAAALVLRKRKDD